MNLLVPSEPPQIRLSLPLGDFSADSLRSMSLEPSLPLHMIVIFEEPAMYLGKARYCVC